MVFCQPGIDLELFGKTPTFCSCLIVVYTGNVRRPGHDTDLVLDGSSRIRDENVTVLG